MFRFDTLPDVRLAAGELIAWQQPRGVQLRVLSGRLWVTRAGDLADHFLHPGDVLLLPPGMPAWIGGETAACVRFDTGGRSQRARFGVGVAQLTDAWRALSWRRPTGLLR